MDESKLDTVPRVTAAFAAGVAQSAQTVGGLKLVKIKHRGGNGPAKTIFDAGGLRLAVSCAFGDESVPARTTVKNSEIELRNIATAADDRIYELHYLGGDGTDVTVHLATQGNVGANVCVVSGYAAIG